MALETVLPVILLATILSLALIHRYRNGTQYYGDIPTVKPRLPLVGNAWSLRMSRLHLILSEWSKVFGPVYRIKLHSEEILVLNDFQSIHEALVVRGSDFAGRPTMYSTNQANRNKHSIVWQTYNERLLFLRKEVLRSFKVYRDGLEGFEKKCVEPINTMLDRITEHHGHSFDPRDCIYEAVSNIMLGLTLDQSFESSSVEFQELKAINKLFNEVYSSNNAKTLDFWPWLPLTRRFSYYNKLKKALHMRDTFWNKEIAKLKLKDSSDCVIRKLLSLDSEGSEETNKTAKEVFTNLILAGTDTTTTALTSLLLVFLHMPDVQQCMWNEVKANVGIQRLVKLSDRPHLPYCQAVLLELLRFTSHVPLAVPHCTVRDTQVQGMRVPKDMTVYINLWAMHHSMECWNDPFNFDPKRFLDASGKLVEPSHPARRRLMAFGAGRRVCLGEVLAKNRLFLFSVSLVQRFHFRRSTYLHQLLDQEMSHDGKYAIENIDVDNGNGILCRGTGQDNLLENDQDCPNYIDEDAHKDTGQDTSKYNDKDNQQCMDQQLLPLDPRTFEMGLVIHPPPFRLCAIARQDTI